MFLGALLAYFLEGCAPGVRQEDPSVFYRRDISFRINNQKCVGACVVPQAAKYLIRGEQERGGKFDLLFIRSCHREVVLEKQGEDFEWTYEPRPGIEDNRTCPLEIQALEQSKGRSSWGFIDFASARDVLPAAVECSGAAKDYAGTSVCQGHAGLTQRVKFTVPVILEAFDPACRFKEPEDRKTFEFKLPVGLCGFVFAEIASPHRTHRLMTLGYQKVVVREF